jgi:flagellar hook-associated protein 2
VSTSSAASTATSGTLGNVAPVSFPGIASGIDYNSIIQKYTADTLQQEKPTIAQINNLTSQNAAVLKIKSLFGAVQDSLTALSDPATFGAFKATVGNTSSGSAAATATQIAGSTPVAGTYTINAQTVATSTVITNNVSANGALSTTAPLDAAGTSIAATNGTSGTGKITINGVQINYDVTSQSLTAIVSAINAALQANDGGSATYNSATGQVTLTGVTSIGSGADSGNLEQVLKLDSAQINAGTLNSAAPLASEVLNTQPTGTNVINAATPLNAIADLKTAPVSGTLVINGISVAVNATDSLNVIAGDITSAGIPGVTASVTGNGISINGVNTIANGGGGNFTSVLNLPPVTTPGATLTSTSSIIYTADVTVNGTSVGYDPKTDSLNAILSRITAKTGVAASVAGNLVTLGASLTSLSDGPGGNLLEALNLPNGASGTTTSSASIYNGTTSTLTSSSSIAGLNQTSVFNQNGNAGFATAVTSGTFTINGVQFTLDATKNSLADVIKTINASNAGVTATYNSSTASLTLTSKTAGPQSILLGAGSDTSNFLTASGLKTGTTKAGTQASLTYTDSNGALNTVYSATNDFTSAIPGVDINITTSSPTGFSGTYYTINVAADPTAAETAINAFVKSYNAVIVELNKDTVAPTVTPSPTGTGDVATSTSSGGGVLYGNFQISTLRDQLVQLVSGFVPSGSNSYNSLASIGLTLDTASSSVGTAADTDDTTASGSSDSTNGANNSFIVNSTSGQLAALDTTTFEAAFAANTSAIQALFTLAPQLSSSQAGAQPVAGSNYGFSYLFGSAVAQADGLSTFLKNQVITPGNLNFSLLTSITDSNNQQIDSLQQQVALINQEATAQADSLRQQFTASETQIAELQALQGQISAIGH